MFITVDHQERATVLALRGDLDTVTAPQLGDSLNEQLAGERSRFVLDFSGVDYTSSAGLRVVLAAVKEARKRDGDVRLAAVQESVWKVFDMGGFTSILEFFDEVELAVQSFS